MTGAVFDLAIVGAGIVGLAHALAAARLGKRVIVIDRDSRANGASIRNFGFVTVTGQQRGECWRRAMRSRDVWAEVAPKAGIRVEHEGLAVVARRPEARTVLEAFLQTEMGQGCTLVDPDEARSWFPMLAPQELSGVLWSPHERRVESRDAVPLLAAWLEQAMGITVWRNTQVRGIDLPRLDTTRGVVEAEAVVICPGDDFHTLKPDRIAAYGLTRCKLHMMRVMPVEPGYRLPGAVMSDLSLARYLGYAELPEAAPLAERLAKEQPDHLANGIHLIAVQGEDGSLIIGDSHHYGDPPDPFDDERVDDLIIQELQATLGIARPRVMERWTGTYASAKDRLMLIDRPSDRERIVIITSGTGASTAFAIAEEVVGDLYGDTDFTRESVA